MKGLFDLSALLSLQVKNWVKELRKMLGNEICLCIVGKLSESGGDPKGS